MGPSDGRKCGGDVSRSRSYLCLRSRRRCSSKSISSRRRWSRDPPSSPGTSTASMPELDRYEEDLSWVC